MNYRHIYHAGNFADVLKHWVLTLILNKLCQKETPFCLLDTHAGLGLYDLQHEHAQNTLEYTTGIDRLLKQNLPEEFKLYINIVNSYMSAHNVYPGSAAIMQHFLRATDRLLLNELHRDDHAILSANFSDDRRIKIFNDDAYQCLKALLPPKERRGLILIDPPFEQKNEIEQIIQGLQEALKRFSTGVYLIWYPIKDRKLIEKFYRDLNAIPLPPTIYVELHANENIAMQLTSCGLIIVNPPWQLDSILRVNMPKLIENLQFRHGTYKITGLSLNS